MTRCQRLVVALLLAVLATGVARANEIRVGSAQLTWPEGFRIAAAGPPVQLAGPNGEAVLVSVMRSNKEIPPEAAAAEQEKMAQMGIGILLKQAEKVGKVSLPLDRRTLADGSLIAYIGSDTGGLFAKGFFLQYLVVSNHGRLAFFTVEGKGNVAEKHLVFRPVFDTLSWLP